MRVSGRLATAPHDLQAVEEKILSVPPHRPEIAAIVGETSDNLPGVPGAGPEDRRPSGSISTTARTNCWRGLTRSVESAELPCVNTWTIVRNRRSIACSPTWTPEVTPSDLRAAPRIAAIDRL